MEIATLVVIFLFGSLVSLPGMPYIPLWATLSTTKISI